MPTENKEQTVTKCDAVKEKTLECLKEMVGLEDTIAEIEKISNRKWRNAFIAIYIEAVQLKGELRLYQRKHDENLYYLLYDLESDGDAHVCILDESQFAEFDFSTRPWAIRPETMTLKDAEKKGYSPTSQLELVEKDNDDE